MLNSAIFKKLQKQTEIFFSRHWCHDTDSSLIPPEWSKPWYFKGDIPNNDKQGCYALLKDEEVVYIGVGSGVGPERYEGAGLGSRLHIYWQKDPKTPVCNDGEKKYRPTKKWEEVTSIVTMPFERAYSYLAYALEIFLISNLKPRRNTIGKAR